MSVTLVIFVFNEERRLPIGMASLIPFLLEHLNCNWEVVIADNGSTDKTFEIGCAEQYRHSNVRAVHFDKRGRGNAIKRAWLSSSADILSYMDVDLSTDLSAYPALIAGLRSGKYDLAIGSRHSQASITIRCFYRRLISHTYNILVRAIFHSSLQDVQCGFKAITRQTAQNLLPYIDDKGWFFDTELLVMAEKLGYRIYHLPVFWVENADSRVKIINTIINDIRGIIRLRKKLKHMI
jgi:glycosyltransferase involved in cell wall biosynthesis